MSVYVIPADSSWFIAVDSDATVCTQVLGWVVDSEEDFTPQPITLDGEAFDVATHQHYDGECLEGETRRVFREFREGGS